MPRYVAISKEVHADRAWRRPDNYSFTRAAALAPLVAAELPRAVMSFPVGFFRDNDGFSPAAILSLATGANLFVTPDGHWLGRHVPTLWRAHPFRLIPNSQDPEKLVFCFDEDSGLAGNETAGQPFFDATGNLAEPTRQVLELLSQHEQSRQATMAACAVLHKQGIIQPWEITIKTGQEERRVEGVYKIDEAALNQLSGEAFERLRTVGALPLAYCQLISMQHLATLGKLAEVHAVHAQKTEKMLQATLPQAETGDIAIDWNLFSQQNRT